MKTIKKTLALYESLIGCGTLCGNWPNMEKVRLTEFVEIEFPLLEEKQETELHDPSR